MCPAPAFLAQAIDACQSSPVPSACPRGGLRACLPAQGFGAAQSARGSVTQSSPGGQCPMPLERPGPPCSASLAHCPPQPHSPAPPPPASSTPDSVPTLSSLPPQPPALLLGPGAKFSRNTFLSKGHRPWTQETPATTLRGSSALGQDACPAPAISRAGTPPAPSRPPSAFLRGAWLTLRSVLRSPVPPPSAEPCLITSQALGHWLLFMRIEPHLLNSWDASLMAAIKCLH